MYCSDLRTNNLKAHIFLTHSEGKRSAMLKKYKDEYLLSCRRVPPLYVTIIAF